MSTDIHCYIEHLTPNGWKLASIKGDEDNPQMFFGKNYDLFDYLGANIEGTDSYMECRGLPYDISPKLKDICNKATMCWGFSYYTLSDLENMFNDMVNKVKFSVKNGWNNDSEEILYLYGAVVAFLGVIRNYLDLCNIIAFGDKARVIFFFDN